MSSNTPPSRSSEAPSRRLLSPLYAVARCLRFYSRLPLPPLPGEPEPYGPPDFSTMPRALPFAGAIIGAIGAAVLCLGIGLNFGSLTTAGLAVAAMTFITGAFHEDGLADTSDGFGGGTTVERRLAIMRDSLIGSFGASALALAFMLRISALAGIAERLPPMTAAAALVIAAFLSRISALYLLTALPPARTDGLSQTVGSISGANFLSGLLLSWLLTATLGLTAGLPVLAICLAPPAALIVCVLMARFSRHMIGGQTGDVAGAAQQLGEIAVYLAVLGATP